MVPAPLPSAMLLHDGKQARLAHPRRPLHQQRGVLGAGRAGRQHVDLAALDRRLEGEVGMASQGWPALRIGLSS
jgi:hypothetical protein